MNERGKGRTGMRALKSRAALLVDAALAEDVGPGDITTRATVPASVRGEGLIIAGEDLVLAGLFVAECVFRKLQRRVVFKALKEDGKNVEKGEIIARVRGRLAPMLTGERVALNFLQRLSGIATLTARFVQKARGVKILDTRKTTPLMRLLERYAVRMGGGYNHRFGLYDGILIKDNHIRAAGGVAEAVRRAEKRYGGSVAVEVETTNLDEVKEAVESGADIIMLDNMTPKTIKRAVALIDGRALIEVSGGVNLANVSRRVMPGVDFISVGAITHSAPAVDISMEIGRLERDG